MNLSYKKDDKFLERIEREMLFFGWIKIISNILIVAVLVFIVYLLLA